MQNPKNINLQSKKLFIFDLDGTLIDSSLDICHTIISACKHVGVTPPSMQELLNCLHQGSQQILKDLLPDDATVKKVLPHFIRFYEKNMLTHTYVYKNIEDILKKISAYATLAVMSNKREAPCRAILKELKLSHYFSDIVGGDTFPVKKPHPLPLIKIAQKLKIDPKETVMIGDSPVDIEAAQKAGMTSIAVFSGFTQKPIVQASNPDISFEHVSDMLEFV